jgi:hypothetical protein
VKPRLLGQQSWHFVGPVPKHAAPYLQAFLLADLTAAIRQPVYVEGEELDWRTSQPFLGNGIDLAVAYPNSSHCSAFAIGFIRSEKDQVVQLIAGSDDGIVIWLNAEPVFTREVNRSFSPREDDCQISLRKGINPILIRVDQYFGDWRFAIELEDADGWPADVNWASAPSRSSKSVYPRAHNLDVDDAALLYVQKLRQRASGGDEPQPGGWSATMPLLRRLGAARQLYEGIRCVQLGDAVAHVWRRCRVGRDHEAVDRQGAG